MVKWNMNKMYDYCSNYGYDLPLMNQKYINTSTKYLFVCKKHGIYEQTWNNHKNGSSCKECKNDKLRNIKKVYSDDDYISWCKNKVYEHIRKDKKRIGCPRCKTPGSRGEKLIINLLKKYNINYEYPKVFSDFKSSLNKPYHFDFYLSDYNVLIEYQGVQHYEPQKFFGGTDRYERRVEIDKMKKEYAKSKGIKLICIPYIVNTKSKLIKYLTNNS